MNIGHLVQAVLVNACYGAKHKDAFKPLVDNGVCVIAVPAKISDEKAIYYAQVHSHSAYHQCMMTCTPPLTMLIE